jgi:hypothetical protein
MEDDTRFLCFMTEKPGYNLKLLDIEPGKTKTLLKENNINHVFFSQACSLNQQSNYVDQYDVKKLTSPSIDITNESSEVARIVSITK